MNSSREARSSWKITSAWGLDAADTSFPSDWPLKSQAPIWQLERCPLLTLSSTSRSALHAHGVTDELVEIALTMAECIEAAADDVANDTRDAAYDDATSR